MKIPEEQKTLAYLKLLAFSITRARHLAWQKKSYEEIADIMDAIHNIPEMLAKWDECDENFLINQLKSYDDNWFDKSKISLKSIYYELLENKKPMWGQVKGK